MTAMRMTEVALISTSQLEEQSVTPWKREVEARTSEERADHDEHCPEHEVHSHEGCRKLAILRLVRRVPVDVRGENQHDDANSGDGHTSHHWMYDVIKEPVRMRFGYRANETNRAKKMLEKTDKEGFTTVKATFAKLADGRNSWQTVRYCKPDFPLIDDNIHKDKIEMFWQFKGVRFAYMNNCVGCFWRSPLLLKHLQDKNPNKLQWFADQETDNATWRSDCRYQDILKWKKQLQLFDDDFNECDSGNCGI